MRWSGTLRRLAAVMLAVGGLAGAGPGALAAGTGIPSVDLAVAAGPSIVAAAGGGGLSGPGLLVGPWLVTGGGPAPQPTGTGTVQLDPAGPDPTIETGLAAALAGSEGAPWLRMTARYDVDLDLGWTSRQVRVDARIALQNTSGVSVDRIVLNTVAAEVGRLRLRSVLVDGTAARATVRDQSVIVSLPARLAAGASLALRVRYTGQVGLSTAGHRWMWAKQHEILNLYRWIPWLSRPIPFNRDNHGDPLVTPTSPEVRVRITADRDLTYATSGERVGKEGRTQTFLARNVRDFNITASPRYQVRSARTPDGETVIRVYTVHGRGELLLRSALRAFKQYEAWIGPYPWPVYNVAESAGGFAMESPALIWMPMLEFTDADVRYITAHETGHQWFYGAVGNDQSADPFADEAMTDFIARRLVHRMRASYCADDRFDKTLYQYRGACYFETIYVQGSRWIDGIRRTMGDARFWSAVRTYYRDNLFGLSSDKRLLEAWRAVAGDKLLARYRVRFPSLYPR